jgi:hypothetical protein
MPRERSISVSTDASYGTMCIKTPEPQQPIIYNNFLKLFKLNYRPKYSTILDKCTIPQIEQLNLPLITAGYRCLKFRKKSDLIDHRIMTLSARKIQRLVRSKLITDDICPVTMNTLVYPYFTFKPPDGGPLIYYDLESLANYLASTGEFKDPKTRIKYDISIVRKIDKMMKEHNKKLEPVDTKQFKSLEEASYDRVFYRDKKQKEDEILILDRELDQVTWTLLKSIENLSVIVGLHEKLRHYEYYFEKLCGISESYAMTCFNRTLCSILNLYKRKLYKNIDVVKYIYKYILSMYEIGIDLRTVNITIESAIFE